MSGRKLLRVLHHFPHDSSLDGVASHEATNRDPESELNCINDEEKNENKQNQSIKHDWDRRGASLNV